MTTIDDIIRDLEYEIDRMTLYNETPNREQLVRDFKMWAKNLRLIGFDQNRFEQAIDMYDEQRSEITELRETVSELVSRLERIKTVVTDLADFGDKK